jgi:HEPN domain-containing protein
MNATTNVIRLVREWIEKAEEDLLTAQVLMSTSENRPVNNVCFHAQQCVEKYIKALLISLSINFPKVHDIGELLQLIPPALKLRLDIPDQERLTDYATVCRYPGEWAAITDAESEEAIVTARKVREAIRAHLPKETLD